MLEFEADTSQDKMIASILTRGRNSFFFLLHECRFTFQNVLILNPKIIHLIRDVLKYKAVF